MMVDGTAGPAPALVRAGSCYGCHSDSTLSNGFSMATPRINVDNYGTDGTDGDTLAGGSFYWVDNGDDAKGHNVVGVAAPDSAAFGLTPPGWNPTFAANGQVNKGLETWNAQLTCAGTNGCHGDHTKADDFDAVRGGHHGGLPNGSTDGETVATSYRFLMGVVGIEDQYWEYKPTAERHNQYFGQARTSDTQFDNKTISYLCAECHGDFHSGADTKGSDDDNWGAPWLRHPTDLDMNTLADKGLKEYQYYNEGTGVANPYSTVAPVASNDITATSTRANIKSTVFVTSGDAIVTCISCHRAHGSLYDDLLRWEYSDMIAAGGESNEGCFVCHTTKD